MAGAFEQVDFIISATNPGPAFAAEAATSQPDRDLPRHGQGHPVGHAPASGA